MERRDFFRSVLGDVAAFADELAGRPQFQISELWSLPDDALAKIIPAVHPQAEILVGADHVAARVPQNTEPVFLFGQEPTEAFVFNRFNGMTPIAEIADEVVGGFGETPERAFAIVKGLFLRLVRLRVCVPANPIDG